MNYQTAPGVKRIWAADKQQAQEIILAICNCFSLPVPDVSKKCRKQTIVKVRRWCCYMLCKETTLKLSEIASFFSGFDHTDVINCRDKVKEQLTSKHPNETKDELPLVCSCLL